VRVSDAEPQVLMLFRELRYAFGILAGKRGNLVNAVGQIIEQDQFRAGPGPACATPRAGRATLEG
jgi:hypothetical protein